MDDDYETCAGEFIQYEDGSMEQVVSKNNGRYFIVSKSGEPYKSIDIYDTKYTVIEEM